MKNTKSYKIFSLSLMISLILTSFATHAMDPYKAYEILEYTRNIGKLFRAEPLEIFPIKEIHEPSALASYIMDILTNHPAACLGVGALGVAGIIKYSTNSAEPRKAPAAKPITQASAEPEIIIKKQPKTETEYKPFEECFEGSVPPMLYTLVERFKNPELYKLDRSIIQYPGNFFMLYGVSGTGKTTMLKELIKAIGTSSVVTDGSAFCLGNNNGHQELDKKFEEAREKAEKFGSCIIFIDECDQILMSRKEITTNNQAFHGAIHLWMLIDAHRISHPNILVVAATNKFELLDDAVKRRVCASAIQLPYKESRKRSGFVALLHSINGGYSEETERNFLKILNNYDRVYLKGAWKEIIKSLERLEVAQLAEVAEAAVRFALDDYYREKKPKRLKELEMDYFHLKKYIAEYIETQKDDSTSTEEDDAYYSADDSYSEEDSSTSESDSHLAHPQYRAALKRLADTTKELKILTKATHKAALEQIIIRQNHIAEALSIVLNNVANGNPTLLHQANEIAKEYNALISLGFSVFQALQTMKNTYDANQHHIESRNMHNEQMDFNRANEQRRQEERQSDRTRHNYELGYDVVKFIIQTGLSVYLKA